MLTFGLFFAALFAVTVVSPLLSIPFLRLAPVLIAPVLRSFRSAYPILKALVTGLPMAGAMLLFVWFAGVFQRQPTLLMFLIPFLLLLKNDLNRIHRAWTGKTPIRVSLESEGETYDPTFQVKSEIGGLIGDSLGFWLVFLLT